jgi:ABC-type multidrug transport system fused ATPase/permease subunit
MSDFYAQMFEAPWLAVLVLLGIVIALYMGRASAHGVLESLFRLLSAGMRLGARSVSIAEKKLRARNREVLIALGKEQAEREISREFFRINKFVERDLGGYPKLQRNIQEQITNINEDYALSGEIPPPSPEWIAAVDTVAQLHLNEKGNSITGKILEDIHQAAEEQHREVLQTYRQSMAERHSILKRMAPYWRKLSNSVDQMGTHLQELTTRAHDIDVRMARYEEICRQTDKAERMLKASAFTQFSIALIVVLIAMAGAYFNFHLIAYPMSEMVDGSNRIGGVKIADIAALVLVFIEITMGIFLLEALHVTRLFPIIGSMDDRMRVRGIWLVGSILLAMACMESGLAFMRDYLAAQDRNLQASLTGADSGDVTWITLAVNMGMGFVLPLALTVVAIPLEYLLHTGRTVIGTLLELILRLLAVSMRIVAVALRHMGHLAIHLYDLLILLPLWIEGVLCRLVQNRNPRRTTVVGEVLDSPDYFAKEASK